MVRYFFTKKFIKGNLEGLTHYESMTFVSHARADSWLKAINSAKTLDYTITEFYPEQPKKF